MKRTISAMVGKGSVNHNSRKFHAKNTDSERSHKNIEYCDEDIREVYRELFSEALERYNGKQTRKDRIIENYYEKICSGKQEKTFHEMILQIGNRDDCSAVTEEGILAASILDEYMKEFQQRNSSLRVFSAHLHMDEATPHLHIDFVPYTTGSKRGLDTRVSLKKALEDMGFKGGTRSETEWNQWVASEKQQLSLVMQQKGIEWEQKGSHEKHLSVLDFEKRERAKEVKALEEEQASLQEKNTILEDISEKILSKIDMVSEELQQAQEEKNVAQEETVKMQKNVAEAEKKWQNLTSNIKQVEQYALQYQREPDEWLPETKALESAKSYRNRMIPLLDGIVNIMRKLYSVHIKDKEKNEKLERQNNDLKERIDRISKRCNQYEQENQKLQLGSANLERVTKILGCKTVENAIQTAMRHERQQIEREQPLKRWYEQNRR